MNRLGWFFFGAIFACLLAAAAGAIILHDARGFSASEPPGVLERWIARRARSAAMPSGARARPNPLQNTPAVLAEARAHWADHCATCHANDGSGDTLLGKHTSPPAPDMRLEATQKLTDGELFYVIQNGIRLTAMPAWSSGSAHDEQDSWKLVHFIRHLPQLTLEEKQEMEKLNPKAPDDLKEEEEEKKFLEGQGEAEPHEHHHH
ncbi:MAG TPA: c-type cytochrome [Bryobacteraceae bacterium]|nr:c-type cytochrome [Bryobacteraceae bacterium]